MPGKIEASGGGSDELELETCRKSSEFIRQKTFARGSLTPTERFGWPSGISAPQQMPLSGPKNPVPSLAAGVLSFQPEAWSRRSIWIVAINEDRPGRGWGPRAISPCDRGGPPKGDTLPLCSEGDGASCWGGALRTSRSAAPAITRRWSCAFFFFIYIKKKKNFFYACRARLRARLYDDRLDVFVGRAALRHDRVGADHRRPRCRPVHQLLRSYSFRAAAHIVPRSRTFDVVERRRISLLLHPAVAL